MRAIAKSVPFGAQSAARTPLRTSFGGPPASGARDRTPLRTNATSPELDAPTIRASVMSMGRKSRGSERVT